jgi:ferredoxin
MEAEKNEKRMIPVIDMSECTDCESCLEICPAVFIKNSEVGHIEVVDLPEYPEEKVRDAVSFCPADCIKWEEV